TSGGTSPEGLGSPMLRRAGDGLRPSRSMSARSNATAMSAPDDVRVLSWLRCSGTILIQTAATLSKPLCRASRSGEAAPAARRSRPGSRRHAGTSEAQAAFTGEMPIRAAGPKRGPHPSPQAHAQRCAEPPKRIIMPQGLNELFHETLKDIYYAEKQILKA